VSTPITVDASGRAVIVKDPQAVLDYSYDWTQWLTDVSDHIVAATVVGTDVVVDSWAFDGFIVTAWLSGGTLGAKAEAVCHIVTAGGREDDRTLFLKIKDR
jgi:hypothetical protein